MVQIFGNWIVEEMKFIKLTAFLLAAFSMVACDDTTDTLGSSITNKVDNLTITDATYNVETQSLVAGPVLSKSNNGIIGRVKDPETGTYLTADYMTQMVPLSTFSVDTLQYIKDANNGELRADSCYLLVSYQSTYGDSLAPMKVTAYEMSKPMTEDKNYLTDFDPIAEGYIDENGYHNSASATYSLSKATGNFKIYLNKPYTKDGVTYDNYGTYMLKKFVEHPDYFKSNYLFLKYVCPGFYIKHEGGIGNVADVWNTEVQFYWSRQKTIKASDGVTDSIAKGYGFNRIDGTEEALQTNHIVNDAASIASLAADPSCTYLKSPAGIFTEVTLPVEEILRGHENDTLNTASITFPRINNTETNNQYTFDTPSYVLMIPKDSINSFFENGNVVNNRNSFYASYSSSTTNGYTFSNISNLITAMSKKKGSSVNWNKAVLIPITVSTVVENNSTMISKMTHNMSLTSTRLVKGTHSENAQDMSSPIQIKVIYSRFKDK